MTFYLGIDGGGTGCRAAVADASGQILGRGSAASANILTDPDGARLNILAATHAALADARLDTRLDALVAGMGLAGANVRETIAPLVARLPFARIAVESDSVTALKGALGAADGITATLGTGSVFARQLDGAITVVGGWGFVIGDHGSGARMGRDLLEAALLAHDGLGSATALLTAVVAEAGGPEALVSFARAAAPAAFAAYVPRILAAADAGDAAATAIVGAATAAVTAAIARLQTEPPLPICFLGGLGPVFAARLADRCGALTRPPKGTPLDGALLLARELG